MGPQSGDCIQQRLVEPLVNHPEKSQSRMWDARLIRRLGQQVSRRQKVLDVDPARKRVQVRMPALPCLVKAQATCEYYIGGLQHPILLERQVGWREAEGGQFVHAI